jgi:high-affinity iron transporter
MLLTWREGFEAAVIIALLIAYLERIGQRSHARTIAYATGSAIVLCAIVGIVVFATTGGLEGHAEELFEGIVGIVAAIVVTHVWRRGVNHRRQLERNAGAALTGERPSRAIFILAFIAVAIEGLEIVLFLAAGAEAGATSLLVGGTIGLVLAVGSGWIVHRTSNLRDAVLFFYVLSAILIVIGAGLLAHGIHELQEAGVFPVVHENLWNLNGVPLIGEDEPIGSFLKSAIGYNGNPELLEVLAYVGYLGFAAWKFDAIGFARRLTRRQHAVPANAG